MQIRVGDFKLRANVSLLKENMRWERAGTMLTPRLGPPSLVKTSLSSRSGFHGKKTWWFIGSHDVGIVSVDHSTILPARRGRRDANGISFSPLFDSSVDHSGSKETGLEPRYSKFVPKASFYVSGRSPIRELTNVDERSVSELQNRCRKRKGKNGLKKRVRAKEEIVDSNRTKQNRQVLVGLRSDNRIRCGPQTKDLDRHVAACYVSMIGRSIGLGCLSTIAQIGLLFA